MQQSTVTVLVVAFVTFLAVFVTVASILILYAGKVYHNIPKKAHKIYLAVGGLLAVWSLYYFVDGYRVNWNFDRIPIGASKAEVVRLLGTPWKVDKCGELFSGGPPNPACAEEYLYQTPFAPWVPNYCSISFDSSGRVMEKYFYSSP